MNDTTIHVSSRVKRILETLKEKLEHKSYNSLIYELIYRFLALTYMSMLEPRKIEELVEIREKERVKNLLDLVKEFDKGVKNGN